MRRILKSAVQSNTLRFGRYPYTYARIMVMKQKLLAKQDYHRLQKLTLSGLLKTLQDTEYKVEIDALAIEYRGIELLERALKKNLINTYNKLRRISSREISVIFDTYLLRGDIQNIKNILRGVHAGFQKEKLKNLIHPVCFTPEEYETILSATTVEEVLRKIQFIPFESFVEGLAHYGATGNLGMIEVTLDQHYFLRMLGAAKAIPEDVRLLRRYLLLLVDLLNLQAILRLKLAHLSPELIQQVVIFKGGRISSQMLHKMIRSDISQFLLDVQNTPYAELFAELDPSNMDVTALENSLERYLLAQSIHFMHSHPLTVDVILGYLFAKEVEIRNLRVLGKALALDLGEEFMEEALVM